MAFNAQVILRVLLILATSLMLATAWAVPGLYVTIFSLAILLLLQAILLLHYINRTNRELTRFLDAIAYDDFSQSFAVKQANKSFRGLGEALNHVVQRFQTLRQEKETSTQFFRLVLRHIPIAVLVISDNNNVVVFNTFAKKLLGINQLHTLSELKEIDASLPEALSNLEREGRKVLEVTVGGMVQQLSVSWTEFVTGSGRQIIISMQNIRAELDQREIRAWQDLIRILSHEIMNSLTPIASLSRSASTLLHPIMGSPQEANPQTLSDIDQALATIARRSEGLLSFVDNYRSLARLPTPKPEYVRAEALFERALTLMQLNDIKIKTQVIPRQLTLFVDPELFLQGLINLIKNAAEAVAEQKNPNIELNAWQDADDNITIGVVDNGCGIKECDREKVWIPFFTTRKQGTGIGLSLTRQIIMLHGGSIHIESEQNAGTRVLMHLGSQT